MTTTDEIAALTEKHLPDDWTDLDTRAVDTVRVLAADAVQRTGNGHPGTAMSLAPLAYTLFQRVMRHDPTDSGWVGRDRFVLSCGHSSLTLYIQLYFSGYGLELDDLKALRTWGSLTPGHPEHGHTNGVEITTGPLGQGLASAVGMAMAARRERGLFDPDAADGRSPFDHYIYVIASDGDIEEGVTAEASSIAGRQQLGNLIVFYDHNEISIEDDTNIALAEDVAARYEAYGWHVQRVTGGENVVGILEAIENAKAVKGRPSFISLRTIIGYPAPKLMNTGKAHGSALGAEEVAAVKRVLGFDPDRSFQVEGEVIAHVRRVAERGAQAHRDWQPSFEDWAARNPANKALYDRLVARALPDGWAERLPSYPVDPKGTSTRKASGEVLSAVADVLPELWGGSADLAESNNTTMAGADSFGPIAAATKEWAAPPLRAHPALRDPRARDGRDPVRHRPARTDQALRRHLPGVLRLHARRRPVGLRDGRSGDLRLDPRLHRPGRGRPHPPARRASGRAAGHPGAGDGPAGGRQRDRLRLEGGAGEAVGPAQRPGRPGPHPAERPHPGGHLRGGRAARRLRARRF
jgi:transketolase